MQFRRPEDLTQAGVLKLDAHSLATGMVSRDLVREQCAAAARDGLIFVLCGPPPMMREVRAGLRALDRDMAEGEFVVLLGPSGSGKSTLLNILGGFDVPSAGSARRREHELAGTTGAALPW